MKKWIGVILILCVWVGGTLAAQAENRWAVLIGISNYQNSRANLRYSARDAIAISHVLSRNEIFPEDHIYLLLNEEATQQNIKQAFCEWLPSRAAPGDIVVIYYSGHGIYSHDLAPQDEADGRDEYLAPYDIDFSNFTRISETGIRDDLIAEWLGKLPSDTVVIFDSCYSGGGIRSPVLSGRPKSISHLLAIQERDSSLSAGGMVRDFSGLPDHVAFLAASLPTQRSWEDSDLEQSIFTYYFLQGLNGAADQNRDGDISVVEAFKFAQQGIAGNQKWKTLQQPVLKFKKDIVLVSQASTLTAVSAPIQPHKDSGEPEVGPLPRVPEISSLKQEGPIKIDLWFEMIEPDGTVRPVPQDQEFQSGERLRMSFRTTRNCYLLIFNMDHSGTARVVYPAPQADKSVFVEKEQPYHTWGSLVPVTGVERFYAVASEQAFSFSQDIFPQLRPNKLQRQQETKRNLSLSYTRIELKHR